MSGFDWRCPVCSIEIDDVDADAAPRPGQIYRCYGCLVELTLDTSTNRLNVAPFEGADENRVPTGPRRI